MGQVRPTHRIVVAMQRKVEADESLQHLIQAQTSATTTTSTTRTAAAPETPSTTTPGYQTSTGTPSDTSWTNAALVDDDEELVAAYREFDSQGQQ